MCHMVGGGGAQALMTLILRQSLFLRTSFLCSERYPAVICTVFPFVIALLDAHP